MAHIDYWTNDDAYALGEDDSTAPYSEFSTDILYQIVVDLIRLGEPMPIDLVVELTQRGIDVSRLEALYDNSI